MAMSRASAMKRRRSPVWWPMTTWLSQERTDEQSKHCEHRKPSGSEAEGADRRLHPDRCTDHAVQHVWGLEARPRRDPAGAARFSAVYAFDFADADRYADFHLARPDRSQ